MPAPSFTARSAEYRALWESMTIVKTRAVSVLATARKIAMHKADYEIVSRETSVPWFVVGIIHAMECGLSFDQHLHNGDPLTARTVQVPKGRPKTGNGPFTWTESAIDALRYDGLDNVGAWSLERICYELESYNGWGYARHHPNVPSPYLWSFSNHYERGKYVADGKWSATAVSQQAGCMALLKALVENGDVTLDKPEVARTGRSGASAPAWPVAEPAKPGYVQVAAQSKSFWMQVQAFFAVVVGLATDWADRAVAWVASFIGILPAKKDEIVSLADTGGQVAGYLSLNASKVVIPLVLMTLVIAAFRHIRDKREMS